MKTEKIKLSWSKKEDDWQFHYPDRMGNRLTGLFFEMLKIEENIRFLQPNILDPDRKPPTLKQMLTESGYDYKTLKITCEKFPKCVSCENRTAGKNIAYCDQCLMKDDNTLN